MNQTDERVLRRILGKADKLIQYTNSEKCLERVRWRLFFDLEELVARARELRIMPDYSDKEPS